MAPGSAKKSPAKAGHTPAQTRRSPSKLAKAASTPAQSPVKKTPVKKTVREYNYTSRLPTEEQRRGNGRVPGRNLIVWGRPRMMEKMMLHLVHACSERKIDLPWDQVAHSINPGSSGNACTQHLVRLRKELIAEGHLVPPPPQRPGAPPLDRNIRGYVRKDQDGNNKLETRPVLFSEKYEDRRFNLPDAFGIHDQIMADSDQDEEAETESDGFSESPLSQGCNSQVSAQSQYTEQSSLMNDYEKEDLRDNDLEERSIAAPQNQFIQTDYNAQVNDEMIFSSPAVHGYHNGAIQPSVQQPATARHSSISSIMAPPPTPKQPSQNSDFGPYKQPFWDASTSEYKDEEWIVFPDIPDSGLHGHNHHSPTSSTSSFRQPPVYGLMPNEYYEQFSQLLEDVRR